MAKYKASLKQKFIETFGEEDFGKMITGLYNKRLMKKKGTIIAFGRGENRLGMIVKVQKKGVYVQEIRTAKDFGFEPIGKPFYVKNERFGRHLGEFGAVGVDPVLAS